MNAPEYPAVLGTYQVVRLLADRPIGRTLLGTDTTGRAVVLTLVHPAVAAGAGFRERFTAQARAAAAAPLWFVAAVVDVDTAADPPWRAEVHVAGSTLQQFVDERGPLGDAGTAALAERLAAGLAAVHAGGFAHGDLTPSTIVLAEEGPRLVGFGLTRAAGPGYGTPGYVAPELAAVGGGAGGAGGAGSDGAGDVFALGAVLAFAATGRPPFAAGPTAGTRRGAPGGGPELAGLAEPVRSAVLACLRENPAERPTAGQVAAMLATPAEAPTTKLRRGAAAVPRTLVGMPPPQPYGGLGAAPHHGGAPPPTLAGVPPARPRRSSRGRLVALLAVVAVLLVGGVVGAIALNSRSGGGVLTTTPPSPTAAAAPTAATASIDPGTGLTLVDVAPFGADGPRFTTPSRNISCRLTDTSPTGDGAARCDVAQTTWPLPPKPADCAGAWGGGASVSGAERAQLTCAGDTVADPGLRVLEYRQAVSYGGVVCDSQETGVRCVNRATGHGFRVARASYDLF
jgi:eukaryotic-like serine/threonine-protein kinase